MHAARLARHHSVEHARRWILRQLGSPGASNLAVLHAAHGFIGACGIERRGAAALFYYWIARRFWGCGYGRIALQLLQEHARGHGIDRLYSSVFADNQRSLALLRNAGFCLLPDVADSAAALSGAVLPFYMRDLRVAGDPLALPALQQELARLLRAAGSALLIQPHAQNKEWVAHVDYP